MTKGLFVGLAGMDIVYYSDEYPERNSKATVSQYRTYTGGPAANEAITFSMLGGDSTLITSIGESAIGNSIKADLESYGVKVIDVSEGLDIMPYVSAIMVDSDGTRTIWSGQRPFPEMNVPKLDDDFDFCMCDCYMYPHSLDVLSGIHGKMPVCLDVDVYSDNVNEYLAIADVAIMSSSVWGRIEVDAMDGLKVGVTRDGDPMLCMERGEQSIVPVNGVNPVDTLGAGDIMHGAFCYYYYLEGLSFRDSMERAGEVATLSVQFRGTREWFDHYKPSESGPSGAVRPNTDQ